MAPEWTPQTFVAARRARLARIAAAAKREMPIAVVAEPAREPPVEDEPAPPPRPPMPTWFEMMSGHREPTILAIQAEVIAEFDGVTLNDMVAHRRDPRGVLARQIAMFLCKILTRHSTTTIGKRFGGRDHSTVYHAWQKIEQMIQTDVDLAARIERIRARLTNA